MPHKSPHLPSLLCQACEAAVQSLTGGLPRGRCATHIIMKKYRLIAKKGEGTFSEVLKAQNIKSGSFVAIKCMRNKFKSIDQVNNLREIQALRRLMPHPNIVNLEEVLYDKPTGRLALVFELMSMNLYELIRGRKNHLNNQLIKIYCFQALRALDQMHSKGVFHRDIKPENILIESSYDVYTGLKLADFGSCRGIKSKKPYTEYISTRWYRAPECLLTDGYYGAEMDIWGIGCVFFELSALFPLFPGENEKDQMSKIHKILGTPKDDALAFFKAHQSRHMSFSWPRQQGTGFRSLIPHVPDSFKDLLQGMLQYDPRKRISARDAVTHPYFADLWVTPMPPEVASAAPAPPGAPTGSSKTTPAAAGAAGGEGGAAGAKSSSDKVRPSATSDHSTAAARRLDTKSP
ncbi:Mok, partial [Symbiodinium sp. KB8]